jgi:hypothetical protein
MTSQMLPNDAAKLPIWLSQLPPTNWTDLHAITKALWTHRKSTDPDFMFANMMAGYAMLSKSKSVSHAMRLYARKCLDYHQANESRFKTAWLDLIGAGNLSSVQEAILGTLHMLMLFKVTASTLFSSTSSHYASSKTERELHVSLKSPYEIGIKNAWMLMNTFLAPSETEQYLEQ